MLFCLLTLFLFKKVRESAQLKLHQVYFAVFIKTVEHNVFTQYSVVVFRRVDAGQVLFVCRFRVYSYLPPVSGAPRSV